MYHAITFLKGRDILVPLVQVGGQVWLAVGQWATNQIWLQPLAGLQIRFQIPSPHGQPRSLTVGHFQVEPPPPTCQPPGLNQNIVTAFGGQRILYSCNRGFPAIVTPSYCCASNIPLTSLAATQGVGVHFFRQRQIAP